MRCSARAHSSGLRRAHAHTHTFHLHAHVHIYNISLTYTRRSALHGVRTLGAPTGECVAAQRSRARLRFSDIHYALHSCVCVCACMVSTLSADGGDSIIYKLLGVNTVRLARCRRRRQQRRRRPLRPPSLYILQTSVEKLACRGRAVRLCAREVRARACDLHNKFEYVFSLCIQYVNCPRYKWVYAAVAAAARM